MNEAVERLAIELESDDPVERSRAALFAGSHGADATSLLPRLLEMVSRNLVLESTENRCGEYAIVSVGTHHFFSRRLLPKPRFLA